MRSVFGTCNLKFYFPRFQHVQQSTKTRQHKAPTFPLSRTSFPRRTPPFPTQIDPLNDSSGFRFPALTPFDQQTSDCSTDLKRRANPPRRPPPFPPNSILDSHRTGRGGAISPRTGRIFRGDPACYSRRRVLRTKRRRDGREEVLRLPPEFRR